MTRDQTLRILQANWGQLRDRFGVHALSLFGSMARNQADDGSDVDLLVEFNRPTGYFGLVQLQLFLENLLGCSVDLGTPGSLRPPLRERAAREAIRVG